MSTSNLTFQPIRGEINSHMAIAHMSNSSCALLYSRGRADMLVIRDQRIKKETGKISTSSHKFKLWYKKEGRRHANKK